LQAKERVFGVLLLGTPDNRNFTAAELRLLLALGHQIGMAVENSYLIQQTARRSEELHILNEIGRALSSTLQPDILFERIYSEINPDVSFPLPSTMASPTKAIRLKCWKASGNPKRTRPPETTCWVVAGASTAPDPRSFSPGNFLADLSPFVMRVQSAWCR
jgi:hypothetical protein